MKKQTEAKYADLIRFVNFSRSFYDYEIDLRGFDARLCDCDNKTILFKTLEKHPAGLYSVIRLRGIFFRCIAIEYRGWFRKAVSTWRSFEP